MNSIVLYKEDFSTYLNDKLKVRNPVNLYEPIHYILQLGGKRLRPVLSLMTCDLFGGNYKDAMDAGLAVEVFHNFTLIHDDIMDSAPIRRGKATVHKKWDLNTGILSGDAMMILAYKCLESYEGEMFKELMLLFNKTSLEVCEGQQLDMDFEIRNDVTIAEYLMMIKNKTSVLVAAAMKMGAIVANANREDALKIYDFGLNLGLAFQLQDDYLDTFGNAAVFGKQIGGDIIENKKTFLYLTAIERFDEFERNELLNYFNTTGNEAEKVKGVTALFLKNNIDELTKLKIEYYSMKAFSILEELSISDKAKETLKAFGLNLMNRTL